NEYTVALLVREARAGAGSRDVVSGVELAHSAPEDAAEAARVAEALGIPAARIRYDAGENAIALEGPLLDRPNEAADAALLAFLDEQAARAIAEQATGPTFRRTLQRLIREGMSERRPD